MTLGKNMAWKIRQKIFPARNMLWHRKQLPNSLRRVDAMWLWAKARRVLWWLGLLLLSPALILWAEWGANGDDDTIICRVLTFSSSSCMNLTTATEYVRRLTLVLIMGVVCWIAALVIFGVRSYMRSVYPELRDHSSSASHVLVGIISFLVLVMVFPVLVITLLSALMTL